MSNTSLSAALIAGVLFSCRSGGVPPCDRANSQLLEVRAATERYQAVEGHLPGDLRELVNRKYLDAPLTDPWGHEISYTPESTAFDLRSVGADGVRGTEDDILPGVPWRTCRSSDGC